MNKDLAECKYQLCLKNQIQSYIDDPETRVFIDYNDEIDGKWMHSIVVENSGAFWLDSFDTKDQALDYIKKNHLKMSIK